GDVFVRAFEDEVILGHGADEIEHGDVEKRLRRISIARIGGRRRWCRSEIVIRGLRENLRDIAMRLTMALEPLVHLALGVAARIRVRAAVHEYAENLREALRGRSLHAGAPMASAAKPRAHVSRREGGEGATTRAMRAKIGMSIGRGPIMVSGRAGDGWHAVPGSSKYIPALTCREAPCVSCTYSECKLHL